MLFQWLSKARHLSGRGTLTATTRMGA